MFLPACHTTGFAWVPLYDYTKLHSCRLVQCITVSYWASVGPVPLVFYCASVFTHLFFFFVTCSVSCTFCVYVLCAPSHLAPRIPFLYTVVRHTLSVCCFSTLRRFGRFASDCIDTANLPHRDFVFIHPSSSASLVAGRLNYWVMQAVSAANVRGSVIRAHDVRKFTFSVNWTRRADLPHILWVLGISSPFSLPLPHYMSVRPSQLCSCGVPSVNGLSGPAGLPRLRVFSPSDARWWSVGFLWAANVPISVFYHVPCALFFVVVCTYCM